MKTLRGRITVGKVTFILLLTVFNLFKSTFAANPAYTIQEIAAGDIPGLSVYTIGNENSNLGLTIRFTSDAPVALSVRIPAGTIFSGKALAKTSARTSACQDMLDPFGMDFGLPGGIPKKSTVAEDGFSFDLDITAFCMDVDLPPPDPSTAIPARVSIVSRDTPLSGFIDSLSAFNACLGGLNRKINLGEELTDREFELTKFLNWVDPSAPGRWTPLSKRSAIPVFLEKRSDNSFEDSFSVEISKYDIQNALWAMIPSDGAFSGKGVREQIEKALHMESRARSDSMMRSANDLLCLSSQTRRLFCEDSLRSFSSNEIRTPYIASNAWTGAGAGWCSRISIPACACAQGADWRIDKVSYLLKSSGAGSFDACILSSQNNSPGTPISARKRVSFPADMDGLTSYQSVDFSSEQLLVNGDFFVALYQNEPSNPRVVMSYVNELRSFAYDGNRWLSDSLCLAFGAVLVQIPDSRAIKSPSFPLSSSKIGIHQQDGRIIFTISPSNAIAEVEIVNPTGRRIRELTTRDYYRGGYVWDFRNSKTRPSPGTYIVGIRDKSGVSAKLFKLY